MKVEWYKELANLKDGDSIIDYINSLEHRIDTLRADNAGNIRISEIAQDLCGDLRNRLDLCNDKLWELGERYDCLEEIDDFLYELEGK